MDLPQWEERFSRIRRSTLLQSYDYARAVAPLYGQKPRWGLIEIDGCAAGLVQGLEAKFCGLHALTIDRGPLWLPGWGGMAHWQSFFARLNRDFPKRFGRKRRLIAEIPASPAARALIEQAGWSAAGPDYTTLWVDLSRDIEALRADLRKNWRNGLSKAERGPLQVEWDTSTEFLPLLTTLYMQDRRERGYPGPEAKTVMALGRGFAARKNLLIGRAMLDHRPVAAILLLLHGTSATYQIGWCGDEGRQHGGHYRLLWSSFTILKDRGITDFDLGGVTDDTASGIADFKSGLGGERCTLAGLFV